MKNDMFTKLSTYRHNVQDWSQLIEDVLTKIGYEHNIHYKSYDDRYVLFSPFTNDRNSMSAMIFRENGNMKIWNGSITLTRKDEEISTSSIMISEWCRELNCMGEYIDFILHWNNVNPLEFRDYKNKLKTFTITNRWNTDSYYTDRQYDTFRKNILKYYYVKDMDVLNNNFEISILTLRNRFSVSNLKPKQKIINYVEIKPTAMQADSVLKYIAKRGLEVIDNIFEPIMVSYENSCISKPAIAITYPNGFVKYRFIYGQERYRTNTKNNESPYDCLFEAKINTGSKYCNVVEGEIEALTVAKYTNSDVYSLHNTNSIPKKSIEQLKKYDEIYVRIDFDSFYNVETELYNRLSELLPDKTIKILPKLNCGNKMVDYNYLHINNLLNNEIIEIFSIDKVVKMRYNNIVDRVEII